MGQRHQVFVIARIRPHGDASTPPKYRCIAAFHHQWCYGSLPVRATHRFISLAKQKDNTEIIAAEIKAIQGLYGVWQQKPDMPRVPAPFVAFLLATSWSIDLEFAEGGAPYASGVSFNNGFLHADMGSGDGDNNDGISIIDVTDPASPAYCFNRIGGLPLSAKQYVGRYYHIPGVSDVDEDDEDDDSIPYAAGGGLSESVASAITLLDDIPMITIQMLAEAWPEEYEATLEEYLKTSPTDATTKVADPPVTLPSLTDMTLDKAVEQGLASGDTADVEELMWRSDMAPVVERNLRSLSPFPSSGLPLLRLIVAKKLELDKTTLDLSGFSLSSEQVAQILASVDGLLSLNLSYNSPLTIDVVSIVLKAIPNLERLVLLGCPSVANGDVYKLLGDEPALFYRLHALIHPALFAALNDVQDASPYRNAFSYIGMDQFPRICALPYFTPASVVQALTGFLTAFTSADIYASNQIMQTGLAPQAMFCAAPLKPGQRWADKSVALIPQYSLGALRGEGWAFCFNWSTFSRGRNAYGFVRVPAEEPSTAEGEPEAGQAAMENAGDVNADEVDKVADELSKTQLGEPEILDLRAFLARMVAEGRPPVPEDAIQTLEETIKKLKGPDYGLHLFAQKELSSFFQMTTFKTQILY